MAVKYRIEYDDTNDVTTRIDIASASWAGAVTSLKASGNPLDIYLPKGDDIFDPVQGSGGEIRVLAQDSDDLRSLFTGNPKEFTVTIYKYTGASPSASDIIFNGYTNTNFYSEPFDEYDNYPITIGFNDGLKLLDEYKYLNAGVTPYTGIESAWDVVLRCLQFNDIAYTDLRVVSDMYYTGYTITNDNILEHLQVNNGNYYDENGEPMSHLEVLEGILKPLGLVCFTQGGSVWIIDPLKLEESSYTVYIYTYATGVFSSTTSVSPNKGIGVTVENFLTGTQLDFQRTFGEVKLNYSGYAPEGLTANPNWSDKQLHSSAGAWSAGSAGSGDAYEVNTTWGGIEDWTVSSGTASWRGTRLEAGDQEEFHAHWVSTNDGLWRLKSVNSEYIVGVTGQYLKIKGQMNPQTVTGYYNGGEPSKDDKIWGLYCKFTIKIGSYYYNRALNVWSTSPTYQYTFFVIRGDGRVDNRWTDWHIVVPLLTGVNGEVEFQIHDDFEGVNENGAVFGGVTFYYHNFRDIDFCISDAAGNELNWDGKYNCALDTDWTGNAPDIDVIHFDSSDGVASHKGAFINDSGEFATNFRYGGMTFATHLAPALFKKYSSQYQDSRMMLTAKLTCADIYTSGLAKTGNISDSVNLAGRKFVLLKGTYNDIDQYISGTWIEIFTDNITIS